MTQRPRVVGIVAGAGSLPREIAAHVTARGDLVHIVSIAGEGDDTDLEPFPLTRVGWAQIGRLLRALRNASVSELVIVGAVRRPDVASLRPDFGVVTNMPAVLRILRTGGDDSILSRIVRFFESKGFKVVSPVDVMPSLRVSAGPLGQERMTAADRADVALGFDVVRALGPFDIGQAVVVADGRIAAIEGAENTDAMLARLVKPPDRRARSVSQGDAIDAPTTTGRRGVLVKRPKPRQEMRVDLPAIGPQTVSRVLEAGLRGVAVLADGAIALERDELARAANLAQMFVEGVADHGGEAAAALAGLRGFVAVGKHKPSSQQSADATKAADALTALRPYARSEGAVIDRGHILAIACGEGHEALASRAGRLRQWGRKSRRQPTAIAVIAVQQLDEVGRLLACAEANRIAGIAVLGVCADDVAPYIAQADGLGLVLLVEKTDRHIKEE
ncbi:UDP-2,3-diacylglucosamine diphosphatase LpxI [Hyphomicrobium sp. D-2]|uniref:LpxI family protein n=1 Tax=Hyphomicrobium sp. D-2 TaxID=3041621 RepID=UPI002458A6C7|nr:UDP-2,3-diacylglucosamine diphosphatase LpxI [Hyphomicrobium sp. D-2]MDH4981402.1 UDP-2,3-diacylglucosamine diphosphatase LpxI [Hyphomicrobium sp. D-2]